MSYPGNKGRVLFELQPLRLRVPTRERIAYIAGFFDGEGNIHIQRQGSGLRPMIAIGNTNLESLRMIRSHLRCGSIVTGTKQKAHYKTPYLWRSCGTRDVYAFLKMVLPFLIVKRESAKDAMRTLRNRYGAELDGSG